MNKWSELFLGLVLIIVPIVIAFYSITWGAWNFWSAAGTFFKGGLFWFIIMIGVLFVLLGISDLKESVNAPAHHHKPAAQMPPVMHNTAEKETAAPKRRSKK
jgi:uncharacterized membrane protein